MIAIALATWRGLHGHCGRERLVTHNPLDGIRQPRAPESLPKALPKALNVDLAVALAQQPGASDKSALCAHAQHRCAVVRLRLARV